MAPHCSNTIAVWACGLWAHKYHQKFIRVNSIEFKWYECNPMVYTSMSQCKDITSQATATEFISKHSIVWYNIIYISTMGLTVL